MFHWKLDGGEKASHVVTWRKNILGTETVQNPVGLFTYTYAFWTLFLTKELMTDLTNNVEAELTVFYNLERNSK